MEELQNYFAELVNQNLVNFGLGKCYKNIDIFKILRFMSHDQKFISWLYSLRKENNCFDIYNYVIYTPNYLIIMKQNGEYILNSFLNNVVISNTTLKEFANFVSYVLVLVNAYLNYYYNHSELKTNEVNNIINEIYENNTKDYLINIPIIYSQ